MSRRVFAATLMALAVVFGLARRLRPGARAVGAARRAHRQAADAKTGPARPRPPAKWMSPRPAARIGPEVQRLLGGVALHARRSDRQGGDDACCCWPRCGRGRSSSTNGWRCAGSAAAPRASRRRFWSGLSLDELYQQFSARADHPLAAVFLSALARMAPRLRGRPAAREPAARHQGPRRQGDERHDHARDRRARKPARLSRHRRLHRALRRPVRHGVGHHEFVLGHRRAP